MLMAMLSTPILIRGKTWSFNTLSVKTDETGTLIVQAIDVLNGNVAFQHSENVSSAPYETSINIDLSNLDHDTILLIYVKVSSHMYLTALAVYDTIGESPGAICDIYYIANGIVVSTKGSTIVLPKNQGITTIAYDPQHKCVYTYKGDQCQSIVCGKSALVELQMKLPRNALYAYSAYIDDPEVQNIVWKVPDLAPIIGAAYAVKQAVRAYPLRLVGASFSFDNDYVYVKARAYISLESPFSWWALAKIIAGVACIIAGAVITAGTFGIGTIAGISLVALGGGLIGSGIQEFYDEMSEKYSKEIVSKAKQIAEQSYREMINTRTSLEQYLNQLVQEGKLTEEEKNKILSYVDSIINEAHEAMNKLTDMVEKAYKAGFNDGYKKGKEDGRKEMYVWTAVAGVGGTIFGALIAHK